MGDLFEDILDSLTPEREESQTSTTFNGLRNLSLYEIAEKLGALEYSAFLNSDFED